MTKLLIRLFIKDNENTENPTVREHYGTLSGIIGIICNVLLSIAKFIIGTLTHSISITADAANNLSDASSSIVTLTGAKIANKPADKEHPFGHGRSEYIAALIVSFIILLMGFELGKSSVDKILHPSALEFSWIAFFVILLAIPVKLWMAYFNSQLYKKTGALSMKAVCKDSLNDCLATGATLISLLVSHYTRFQIDGYIGMVVAVIILIAGVNMVKEIIAPLLGQSPDPALVKQIETIILSSDIIIGVHDLIVHDYGPNRIIASAHAEVPSDMDINLIHDVIDNIELQIQKELNIICVLHTDPLVVDDEKVNGLKEQTEEIIHCIDTELAFHDFRVVEGNTHTNIIFDLVIPYQYTLSSNELRERIETAIQKINPHYRLVINVEHAFVSKE